MGVVTNKTTITKIFCIMNQTCSYRISSNKRPGGECIFKIGGDY